MRSTAEDVRKITRRARSVEVCLVALVAVGIAVAAFFSASNSAKIRDLSEANSRLLKTANEQRQAVLTLAEIIQTYNEAHAKQAEESFKILHEAQKCAVLKLFTGMSFEQVTPEAIAACYVPVTPSPPSPQRPTENKPATTTTGP